MGTDWKPFAIDTPSPFFLEDLFVNLHSELKRVKSREYKRRGVQKCVSLLMGHLKEILSRVVLIFGLINVGYQIQSPH